ncbi:hypothetical protein [Candidatus Magnetaquicoccus inordinatus]|uniref:hypothetical protein n=1 Tax=Candidatus Magnetaquicoccus inordinatus TaxID=2496818 RepID=UPI00102B9D49|nr:hypothetical protein [Candidatus Magnetaquicoccus inordinatus]
MANNTQCESPKEYQKDSAPEEWLPMSIPEKIDLFAMAAKNSIHLEKEYQKLHSPETNGAVDRFCTMVMQTSHISINFKPTACAQFLASGRHLNIHELVELSSEHADLTHEEKIFKALPDSAEERLGFDNSFEKGEQIRYGALNMGGGGALYFDNICVVLKQSFPENKDEVAYCERDSFGYVNRSMVNLTGLSKALAAESHKGKLATIKHCKELALHPEESWPNILCSRNSYVEALFWQAPTVESIACVRIANQNDYEELVVKAATVKLDKNEAQNLARYHEIVELLAKHNITLDKV